MVQPAQIMTIGIQDYYESGDRSRFLMAMIEIINKNQMKTR